MPLIDDWTLGNPPGPADRGRRAEGHADPGNGNRRTLRAPWTWPVTEPTTTTGGLIVDPATSDDTDYLVTITDEDDDPESLAGDEIDIDPAAVADGEE